MADVRVYKRPLKWFQEAGEQPLPVSGQRMNEAYESSRIKPGSDGRNPPKITDKYAGKSGRADHEYDDLGASSGKKTTKGTQAKVSVKEKQKRVKEEEDFQDEEPMDSEFDSDIGGEGDDFENEDVPPALDDEGEFGDMDGDGDGSNPDDVAADTTVEIGGQKFKLVPIEDEEGGEGDEFGGDEFGAEGEGEGDEFGGDEFGAEGEGKGFDNDEVEAEDDDLTHPRESTKARGKKDKYDEILDRSIARLKAKNKGKKGTVNEATVKKLLSMKVYAEKKLQELFTGSYVINKQGETGFDFKDVGGDTKFAIAAPARDGKQYTVTVDDEPTYDDEELSSAPSKAPIRQKPKTPTSESKKIAFQKWLKEQEKKYLGEEDAGVASERFNKMDTEDNYIGDDLANMPEVLGAEKDQITTYNGVKEQRRARRQEGAETPAGLLGMREKFDFKKFMNTNK